MPRSPEKPRRRRIRRWVLLVATPMLLATGAALVLPYALGTALPGILEDRIEHRLDARAEVGSVSLSWTGAFALRNLHLDDLEGRPLLRLAALDGDLDLASAAFGSVDGSVRIEGLELHLRPGETQRLQWVEILRRLPASEGRKEHGRRGNQEEGRPRARAGGGKPWPDARGEISITGGRVLVYGREGETRLDPVDLTVRFDGPDRPAHLSLHAALAGPAGEGTFTLEAEAIPKRALEEPTTSSTSVEARWTQTSLASLAPLFSLLGIEVVPTAGRLDLQASVTSADRGLRDRIEVRLTDAAATTARGGDLRLPPLKWRLDGEAGGDVVKQRFRADLGGELSAQGSFAVDRSAEEPSVTGDVRLVGDIRGASGWLEALGLLRPGLGLEGGLEADASLSAVLAERGTTGQGSLHLAVEHAVAHDATGGVVELPSLSEARVEAGGSLDLGEGSLDVQRLEASFGAAHLSGSGRLDQEGGAATLRADVDLEAVARDLEVLLPEPPFDMAGRIGLDVAIRRPTPEELRGTVSLEGRGLRIGGTSIASAPLRAEIVGKRVTTGQDVSFHVDTDAIDLSLSDGRRIAQRDVRLEGLLGIAPGYASLEFEHARLATATLTLDASGRLDRTGSEAPTVSLRAQAATALQRLRRDLPDLLADVPVEGAADLSVRGSIDGALDSPAFDLTAVADGVDLHGPVREGGEQPWALKDERVRIASQGRFLRSEGRIDLDAVHLASRVLSADLVGRLDGLPPRPPPLILDHLRGQARYVPALLAPLLPASLPVELEGDEPRTVRIDASGRFDELDLVALLLGADADLDVDLGLLRAPGLALDGSVQTRLQEGGAHVVGRFDANGGTLELESTCGPADGDALPLVLDVKAEGVRFDADLSPALSFLHPVFATEKDTRADSFGGRLWLSVHVTSGTPLSLEDLVERSERLDLSEMRGTVRVEVKDAVLQASPFLSELLSRLDVPVGSDIDLAPMELSLRDGVLAYAKPWVFRVAGIKTTFTGEIGLDQSLRLAWNLPITKKLARRHSFLEPLLGETFSVPIGGTTTAPHLEFEAALADLSRGLIQHKVSEKTGGLLDDVLGEPDAKEDPAEILAEADALWKAGDRTGAQKLYRKLRKRYRLTLPYLLNKKRIDKRAKKKL